jgi:hypothetical protein
MPAALASSNICHHVPQRIEGGDGRGRRTVVCISLISSGGLPGSSILLVDIDLIVPHHSNKNPGSISDRSFLIIINIYEPIRLLVRRIL